MYVAAKSGLSLRSAQSTSSSILTKIVYAEKVIVLKLDSSLNVEGFATSWAKVSYKGNIGYVADIYLFEYAPPKPGTEIAEDYFKQLSTLAMPKILIGDTSIEARDAGAINITKSFYKNGLEYHFMQGYENGISTYVIPNSSIERVFQIFRNIPEFKMVIQPSTIFPKTSKVIDNQHRIVVRYMLDENNKPIQDIIESIEFYAEEEIHFDIRFYEAGGQVYVLFSDGV